MNIDEFGLIVGIKEDPGDSCHRTMMFILGDTWFSRPRFGKHYVSQCFKYFECKKDHYCRHPSMGWWSDCDRLSRDQATPLVIALGMYDRSRLRRFFKEHIKRFGFFTNTRNNGATKENFGELKYPGHETWGRYDYHWKMPDFITPDFVGIYIRAFDAWYLYPLLLVLDIWLVLGSLVWKFKEDQDVLNHVIICEYFTRKYNTPWSLLAKLLNNKKSFNKKMAAYFMRVGLVEMYKMWRLK